MATIKSFSDLQQSKKLAEILPLESADMYYWCADHYPKEDWIIEVGTPDDNYECICAWSLAALLGVLPRIDIEKEIWFDDTYSYRVKAYIGDGYVGDWFDNPIDACYELILKLHELKML